MESIFNIRINNLLPCHLPGRPTSFQTYLNSVFPNPPNFSMERQHIHSLSASTSIYKDARIRAFVSDCFPPQKLEAFLGSVLALRLLVMCFPSFQKWIRATAVVKFVSHIASGLFSTTIRILPQGPNKHLLMQSLLAQRNSSSQVWCRCMSIACLNVMLKQPAFGARKEF